MADVNISKYRASVVRDGSKPATPGFVVSEGQDPVDPAGNSQNHLPVTIAPAATGLSITESQILSGAGTVGQYIRGDGSLADFPSSSGGGSSVSYYLNGSVNQATISGINYRELNKVPILGAGTDFTISTDGYIASFLTDAGDPNLLEIPGGNWNFETYFSASSSGGSPSFYIELYKYDGSTFTLIASSSSSPELIAFGTNLNPYFSTLAVPTTVLSLTDRLAIRYYVTHSGRTITLHTENNHLCQVVTTFTTGLTSLNGLTAQVQNLAVGTSGTDFNIASATATHTFNLPTASATNRGALSSADWTTFNNKQNALGYTPVPETRTITINGTTQDLSANRTFNVGTVTSVGLSSATSGVTIGSTPVTGSGTITLAIATASGSQNGLLSSTDWSTFNSKQNAITLTTSGSSGAATLVGSTLNIPQYQAAGTYVTAVTASSPLASSGGTTPNITIQQASGSQSGFLSSTDWTTFNSKQNALTNPVTGTGTTNYLPKFTGSTTIGNSNLINDSNGNLGLGVTPSAWGLFRALQIGLNYGALSFGGIGGTIITNAFFDGGTYRYLNNDFAAAFEYNISNGGGFVWRQAPSGTAGNAISFTQAMTLNASGNLLVGTTTDNGARLQVSGTSTFSGPGAAVSISNASDIWYNVTRGSSFTNIGVDSTGSYYNTNTSHRFLTRSGTINALTLASTGAATFSSSVAAGKITTSGAAALPSSSALSEAILLIQDSGSNRRLGIGSSTSGQWIQSSYPGVDGIASTLLLNPSGGNVGIGTASPNSILEVYGQTRISASGGSVLLITPDATSTNGVTLESSYYGFAGYGPMKFNTSGSERLRITSGGNLLVGTTSDAGYKLDVNGSGRYLSGSSSTIGLIVGGAGGAGSTRQGQIRFGDAGSVYKIQGGEDYSAFNFMIGTGTPLTIASNGNVGIGTSSPQSIFHIGKDAPANAGVKPYTGLSASYEGFLFDYYYNTSAANVRVFDVAALGFAVSGAGGSELRFLTVPQTSTNTPLERLRITSGGDVRVNHTNDFAATFSVNKVAGRNIVNLSNGIDADITFNVSEVGAGSRFARITPSVSGQPIQLGVNNNNVLIGTTTDVGARLHVNGDIRTAAPTGGSAVNWRLGTARAGTITPNATVRVEIGGVLVDLDARYV